MITSNKKSVQHIVEHCIAHGMKHVVCSPGSRNAPFAIAFDEHPEITCYVIHDERSAAFFALGMSQQLNAPVGIVCTSGSAALNYYPAVAEAFYQCVPLVVITADRPQAWVNQGDGQTIVQENVFQGHVRYACQFGEKVDSADEQWYIEREIATAFAEGATYWKGPIHFNVAFNEPLYGTSEIEERLTTRKILRVEGKFHFSSEMARYCAKQLETPKKMIICGQLPPDPALWKELIALAQDSSIALLVENTSNLFDLKWIHCIDRTLNAISEDELAAFAPDLLITLGGAVVSKRIKAYIRKFPPKQHWKIGYEFPYMDTYQQLTHSFQAEPAEFLHAINQLSYQRNVSNYGAKWKQRDFLVQEKLPAFFQHLAFSDLKVVETVLDFLPENAHLHIANSSIVRYTQLFDPIQSVTYWSNRGTSGIDGSSSTACGAAAANPSALHVLLTGDVSFFYDSNALWNHYLGKNLRIILINNGGGGIFKIIPGPSTSKQLSTYFEAKHSFRAEHLCQAFDIEYVAVGTTSSLENQMEDFYRYEEGGRPKLLEVSTPSDLNPTLLEAFFEKLKP